MGGVDDAINTATQLDEIGFTEFTTKLVSDVFDTLIASNIQQQEAYVELLAAVAKSLSEFITDTKDDIGPAELLPFLAAVLPPADLDGADDLSRVAEGQTLTNDDVEALNAAVEVPGTNNDNKVALQLATDDDDPIPKRTLIKDDVSAIMDAVAVRIAANKYTLLQGMVNQGLLRLVVENGKIETRLNFRTYGADYFSELASSSRRSQFDFAAKAKTGGALSKWVKASASTKYTNVRVSSNFRTDYLPLDRPEV